MPKTKRINLALQGGGAHGAFTWGVLDQLLERPDLEIGWISATSAGALNAVVLASGMADGGPQEARAKLRRLWEAIHKAGVPEFIRLNPMMASFSSLSAASGMAKMFSPYDFNPLGFDPLRGLLTNLVDFSKLRAAPGIELLIAATDIGSGRPRFFRRQEITIEAVLASACLPTLHHAVEIDGRAYWDGGYSANPDLVQLALASPVSDTLIVLLNPTSTQKTPTTTQEIAQETNRLTFNAPLLRDVAIIEAVREAEGGWLQRRVWRPSRLAPLARHRFHLIEAGRHTAGLPAGSKMKPDWGLFTYLHGAGRMEAYRWLDVCHGSIGKQATVDLKARFLTELPQIVPPATLQSKPQAKPSITPAANADKTAQPSKPTAGPAVTVEPAARTPR